MTTSLCCSHVVAASVAAVLAAAASVSDAAVLAQLDRSTVAPGESLTLILSAEGSSPPAPPDLAPLAKDFIIQGSGQQSSTSIVNGKLSRSISWQIRLQPRHAGSLQIPPLSVGGEQTPALEVTVSPASPAERALTAEHVFIEVEAGNAPAGNAPPPVMLQQQIPYTLRLFHDASIQNGEILAPKPADANVQQLGPDDKYGATRNGRSYQVIERHYAIAPERSGSLQIPPARFQGTMIVARAPGADDDGGAGLANNSLLAQMLRNTPFANDPMFRGMNGGAVETRAVTAEGPTITVKVEARPAGAAKAMGNWLPAESIVLQDSWHDLPPADLRAGEPVSRTITIQAKGLSAAQIPPLGLLPAPPNSRAYADEPDNQSRTDGHTIYGISKQTVTYIPDAAGTLEVPAVSLDWWNVRTHAVSHSELPAVRLQVAPGAGPQAPVNAAQQPAQPRATLAPSSGTGPADRWAWLPRLPRLPHPADLHWRHEWSIGALLAVGLALLIAWAIRREPGSEPLADDEDWQDLTPNKAASLRALRRACRADDRQAAGRALIDLAHAQWPADPPRGLSGLAARLEAGATEVAALDRSLYGADQAQPWRGEALWQALSRGLRQKEKGPEPELGSGLAALYRN